MSFKGFILSAIASIRSQFLLSVDQLVTTDVRSSVYCWNYRHTEYGNYNAVEVEDLSDSMQLDDASIFLDNTKKYEPILLCTYENTHDLCAASKICTLLCIKKMLPRAYELVRTSVISWKNLKP